MVGDGCAQRRAAWRPRPAALPARPSPPACSRSLMCHLRADEDLYHQLATKLEPEELEALMASTHRPNYCVQARVWRARVAGGAPRGRGPSNTPHALPAGLGWAGLGWAGLASPGPGPTPQRSPPKTPPSPAAAGADSGASGGRLAGGGCGHERQWGKRQGLGPRAHGRKPDRVCGGCLQQHVLARNRLDCELACSVGGPAGG